MQERSPQGPTVPLRVPDGVPATETYHRAYGVCCRGKRCPVVMVNVRESLTRGVGLGVGLLVFLWHGLWRAWARTCLHINRVLLYFTPYGGGRVKTSKHLKARRMHPALP